MDFECECDLRYLDLLPTPLIYPACRAHRFKFSYALHKLPETLTSRHNASFPLERFRYSRYRCFRLTRDGLVVWCLDSSSCTIWTKTLWLRVPPSRRTPSSSSISGCSNLENVKLRFSDDALRAISREAMSRKVGARGLRMILEELMLDLMYTLPSQKRVRECESHA